MSWQKFKHWATTCKKPECLYCTIRKSGAKNHVSYMALLVFGFVGAGIIMITMFNGYSGYTVAISKCCGSMEPYLHDGCVILQQKLSLQEVNELEVGDVVAYYDPKYRLPSPMGVSFVHHRIIGDCGNNALFEFKGDNNEYSDGCYDKYSVHSKLVWKMCPEDILRGSE